MPSRRNNSVTTQIQKVTDTSTFHDERKKVFKPMFVLESKGKDKIKS